ncbi:ABC transporter ATP-binding protein [Croceimicrobium hydrocarbonivorans]|uniref:ABC transporter ATP-binding protein n=1 Tax=Croceimicrobium hydrocarbonivorans TaxID=2761580 RepID=UPI001B3569A3|nr:ABC transporter ATP-binding protein [Croceimicrobium hydrocarbonivorans]
MEILEVKDLTKVYNSQTVLDIPELKFKAGQSMGLVGNNGAGKTTLFRLILDLIKANRGSVWSKGEDVSKSEIWKKYTGSFIDEGFLIDYLSPDEYFQFIGRLHGLTRGDLEARLAQYEDFFAGEIRGGKKYIRDLSKGNQKKVGVVGALLGDPDILILDEPFANLDPSTQYRLRDELKKLDQQTDITMLISSHDLGHVTEFCERIVILDHGKVVKDIHTNTETLSELEDFFIQKIKGKASPVEEGEAFSESKE